MEKMKKLLCISLILFAFACASDPQKEMEKAIEVEGMMCAHCQMHVQKALAAVEGRSEAAVDLEAKKAVVKLSQEVSDETLMKAVEDAGYTAVSCSVQ